MGRSLPARPPACLLPFAFGSCGVPDFSHSAESFEEDAVTVFLQTSLLTAALPARQPAPVLVTRRLVVTGF